MAEGTPIGKENKKKKSTWVSLSTIGRRGKTKDIRVSTKEGDDMELVVKRPKEAGNLTSLTGFAKGEVFHQDLVDES